MALEKKPTYPILVPQGKTFNTTKMALKNRHGNPFDLTDYTARCEVRTALPTVATSEVVATYTTEDETISIDGPSGKFWINLTAEQTASLAPGKYIYEIELISPDGYRPYFMQPSKFTVLAENTLDPEV